MTKLYDYTFMIHLSS